MLKIATEKKSPTSKKTKLQNDTPTELISMAQVENRWRRMFSDKSTMNPNGFLMNTGSMFVNDPYLLNQRIKQLKTLPNFLDRNLIEEALIDPQNNELALRTATHSMLYLTYPLYRLQYLYEGILKYHNYIQPMYVDKKDFKLDDFKSENKFIDKWQKKLDSKKTFRRIVAEVIPEGKRAYYLRQSYTTKKDKESVDYVVLQDLPSDWYKVIKHSTDSYAVVAFNFAYFWQAGTTLGQFPPIFGKYYQDLMNATTIDKNGRKLINPSLTPEGAVVEYSNETMSWFYWMELPSDECFVFSFTEADDFQISPFSSLLLQAQDLSSYSLLQQQLLAVPLYSMLLGEMPVHTKNTSGTELDDFTFSPEAVNSFENKVNSGMPPGTQFNIVPSQKNTLFHFEAIPNANEIYDKGLQQMINTAGASTLMTTTSKPSVAQVNAGKIIETRFIDRMYDQYQWAMNIILAKMHKKGDLKHEWYFRIFGDSFSQEKEVARLEKSLTLGHVENLPEYLAYSEKTVLDASCTIDWVLSTDMYNKFKPMLEKATTSDFGEKEGRKPADENDIQSDATAASMDGGTNTVDTKDFALKKCPICGEEMTSDGECYPFCSYECKESYIEENGEE